MSSYVFPARHKNLGMYVGRLSAYYAASAVAAGALAAVLVLGIVHPVFTALALTGICVALVIGQIWYRNARFAIDRRDRQIVYLRGQVQNLDQMCAWRQEVIVALTEEIRQLKEELEDSPYKKKSA